LEAKLASLSQETEARERSLERRRLRHIRSMLEIGE